MRRATALLAASLLCSVVALAASLLCSVVAPAASAEPAAQQSFESPEAAAAALLAALQASDAQALLAVLGPDAEPIIHSGDPVADRNASERFAEAYAQAHSFAADAEGSLVLQVGEDAWPLPIPLVQGEAGWRFDSLAGQQEILSRRIGRNELHAIQACLAYVDAQREYFLRKPEGGVLPHYARRFVSSPGRKDGLYWPAGEEEEPSPLGPLFAEASDEGYALGSGPGGAPVPYHGYLYRILTAQGPAARGGAYDYLVRDALFGGFALVAHPAEYDVSGVMTFLVNQDGVVFQKDLGPDTEALAQAITLFDPDETWTRP
jgi:hypothetical protein